MKTIKIFSFPTHGTEKRTTGVDMVRMIQPMQYLNGFEYDGYKFEVDIFDPKEELAKKQPISWINIAKNYDLIYLNYMPNAWGYAAMGAMARSRNRKIVMDIDDSLWDIKSDNTAYEVYHRGTEALNNFTAMCNDVDYMTCANSYLKNIILNETYKRADKVRVFPNYIDLDKLYTFRRKPIQRGRITLIHYGSSTHFVDLANEAFAKGIDRIMHEYPNVDVKFVGAFISKYRQRWGQRYMNAFGDEDIYKWIDNKFPEYMQEGDIMVVPLTNDRYNRCKSNIKFLETGSAKIPGVWQRIRQYEEVINGKNGLLAERAEDWYKAIKTLIDDEQLRYKMGEEAFKTVSEKYQMKDHVEDYAKFFIEILTNES